MKKIEEFYHEFKGYGIHDSRIKVHIYEGLVVLQDLSEGTSVTNAAEQLATEIRELKNLDPNTRWIAVYPYYDNDCDEFDFEYIEMSRKHIRVKMKRAPDEIQELVKTITDEKKPTEQSEKKPTEQSEKK